MNEIKEMTNKIAKTIIFILLLFLLLFWGALPQILLSLMGREYKDIPEIMRILMAFINDILLIIIFLSIYKKTIKKDFKNYFGKNIKNNIKESFSNWLLGFGIMITSNLVIVIITNGQLAANEEAVRGLIDKYPLYMAFQLVLYAPITEEIVFRKSIKDIIKNKNLYIIVSGLIFGGLHVLTSLSNPLGFLYLIPYCTLGCIFAHLYQKTDNIFSTITAHSFHNTIALLVYLRGIK